MVISITDNTALSVNDEDYLLAADVVIDNNLSLNITAENARIFVDGKFITNDLLIAFGDSNGDNRYYIGDSGLISGAIALDLNAGHNTIFNDGYLYGNTGGAIAVTALLVDGVSIINSGLIEGGLGVAIAAALPPGHPIDTFTLENTGTIVGDVNATAQLGFITNQGTILGAVNVGIDQSGGEFLPFLLTNTGVINAGPFAEAAITGDDAPMYLRNAGLVEGHIDLGGGRDFYQAIGSGSVRGEVRGDDGNDSLVGNSENEFIYGGADDDVVRGMDGYDFLRGGDGVDSVYGGAGDDIISGGAGHDFLRGDGGSDQMDGDGGNDRLYGGEGNDTASGGVGDDTIDGGAGDDLLRGQGNNDVIMGRAGDDVLVGGRGFDQLNGGSGQDFLKGGLGQDKINGGMGDDRLFGEEGHDVLYGNKGDDRLVGGAGNDTLMGQGGEDTYVFSDGDGADVIFGFVHDEDALDFSSFDFEDIGDAMALASEDSGGVLFEFSAGNTLMISRADIAAIAEDIII